MGPDEILQDGDEVNNGLWGWGLSLLVGLKAGTELRYRRRVTPEAPAPQLSPAAVSAMCQINERAALLKKIDTLKAESDQQQEIILHAGLEVERLTAEKMEWIKNVSANHKPFESDEIKTPDVGDGWRWLELGEILCKGDEFLPEWSRDDEQNPWRETHDCTGMPVAANKQHTYRRRATVPEAPQSRPAETRATTRAEQPLGAYLDEENNELREQVVTLTAEVERLRLRPEEIACINEFADELSNNLPVTAMVVRDVIKRLGGGE